MITAQRSRVDVTSLLGRMLPAAGPYLAAVMGALVAGWLSASGNLILVVLFVGLILGALTAPSKAALFWFVVIGGLVVVGVAQLYLPGSKHLRYLVPLATLALLVHGVMERLGAPEHAKSPPIPPLLWWAIGFLGVAIASTAANWPGVGVAILGVKGYFQMWGLLFALVFVRWTPRLLESLPRAILFVAFVQLPFAVHQYLILVPRRASLGGGVVAADVIAGTFGATETGGGANAVLAVFLFVVLGCLLGLWKKGVLSSLKLVFFVPVLLSPLFVNQTKISAIYLPILFLVIFYDDIVRRPGRFLAIGAVAGAALVAMVAAIVVLQPNKDIKSWQDLIAWVIERQTADIAERAGPGSSDLSRFTALTFWAGEHAHANVGHALIGHGLGASRARDAGLDLGDTLADKEYGGIEIGYTALSALLWDTGIIGLVLVLGMFYSAFRMCGRLAERFEDRRDLSGIFEGLRGGIVVLALSLAHRDFFAFHLPYQTLILLVFGYVAVWYMQPHDPAGSDKNLGRKARVRSRAGG